MHALLHDYSEPHAVWHGFRALSSTNAGLLSTLFLSSRLEKHEARFCFIVLGLCVFTLLPLVLAHLRLVHGASVYPVLACVWPLAAGAALHRVCSMQSLGYQWTVWLFGALVLCVNAVAPLMLHRMQRLKHVLKGQWSEFLLPQPD